MPDDDLALTNISITRIWLSSQGKDHCIGSAFLVKGGYAITCDHIFRELPEDQYDQLRLAGPWAGGSESAVLRVLRPRWEKNWLDVAVIELMHMQPDHGAFLPLRTLRPASGNRIVLKGYDTTTRDLRSLTAAVSNIDRVARRIVVDRHIGPGMSGGPAIMKGSAIGITVATDPERNISYVLPLDLCARFIESALGFSPFETEPARSTGGPGTPPDRHKPTTAVSTGLISGLSFNRIGSIHLHVDGGRGLDLADAAVAILAGDGYTQSDIATVVDHTWGPQRYTYPDLYQDHTPGSEVNVEELDYFSTTLLCEDAGTITEAEKLRLEASVQKVIGRISVGQGRGAVLEAEYILGKIDADGSPDFADEIDAASYFAPSVFSYVKKGLLKGLSSQKTYEVHFAIDIDVDIDIDGENENAPPLSLDDLAKECATNGIVVGGWFLFRDPARWSYRSNMFLPRISQAEALESWRSLSSLIAAYPDRRVNRARVRVLVEQSLGVWKDPFPKAFESMTIPELAHWEAGLSELETFLVVTGNFFGDRDNDVLEAMKINFSRGTKYVYFLHTYADLRRWLKFRSRLEQINPAYKRQCEAYLVEFTKDSPPLEIQNIECFIAILRDGTSQGFWLRAQNQPHGLVNAMPMPRETIDRVRDLLDPVVKNERIRLFRRIEESDGSDDFSGVLVHSTVRFAADDPEEHEFGEAFERLCEDCDDEIAAKVSKFGGWISSSIRGEYVIVFSDGQKRMSRALETAVFIMTTFRAAFKRLLPNAMATVSVVVDFGTMRSVIYSHGFSLAGPILRRCRSIMADPLPDATLLTDDARFALSQEEHDTVRCLERWQRGGEATACHRLKWWNETPL